MDCATGQDDPEAKFQKHILEVLGFNLGPATWFSSLSAGKHKVYYLEWAITAFLQSLFVILSPNAIDL
jgi:hypothetical protein